MRAGSTGIPIGDTRQYCSAARVTPGGFEIAIRRGSAPLLALVFLLVPTSASPNAALAAATYSGAVISDEGGIIGRATPVVVDADPSEIAGTFDGFAVLITVADYRFTFSRGAGPFVLGRYENLLSWLNGTDPGMRVEKTGQSCPRTTLGSFTLLRLPQGDAEGNLTAFSADLQWRCEIDVPGEPARWIYASIRLDAPTPPSLLSVPTNLEIDDTTVGTASRITVAIPSIGRGQVLAGDLTLSGADASMFRIENDACSDATVLGGSSCTFDLVFEPTATQERFALLSVGADVPHYPHTILVQGRGTSPLLLEPSAMTLNGDAGGWVVDGAVHKYFGDQLTDGGGVGDARAAGVVFPDGNTSVGAPDPDVLEVGRYEVPVPNGEPQANVSASAFGHGCNWATGWFEVLAPPIYDTDGSLLSVAYDFEHHCEGAPERLRGSVRFHSTIPLWDIAPPGDAGGPSGTVDAGDSHTRTRNLTLSTSATDLSGVTLVALSNDGTTWTTRSYAPTQAWTLPSTNGMHTVYVKWRDWVGNWSPVESDTIVLDTVSPTSTAPTWRLVNGSAISAGRTTVRLGWTGSDATSGIDRYELAQSTDGGAWTSLSTALTATSLDRALGHGHSYRFRVRAVDAAGNVGAWMTGPTFRLTHYGESSASVTYTGSWSISTSPAYWGGRAKASGQAGAKASLTFSGRSVELVSRKGPARGKAQIYINGVLKATVDLYAASYQNQRVVWTGSWSSVAKRTITVRVVGTSGRPRVDLDAFVVGS